MLKRMSILVRLPSDDQAMFSRKWQRHGTLVSHLPGIHSYIQNHVEEQFGSANVKANGIVELRFDSLEAMHSAFTTEAAKPVRNDEPNFLGHGTGYILEAPTPIQTAVDGSKLILALKLEKSPEQIDSIEDFAKSLEGYRDLVRDNVASILARREMAEGPQHVDAFLHIYFDRPESARRAGQTLAERYGLATKAPNEFLSIFRVRTITYI